MDLALQSIAVIIGFKLAGLGALINDSAASKIPPEIWLMVWRLLSTRNLIVVSHVCRSWREMVIGTSSLWTDVAITLDVHHARCGRHECHQRAVSHLQRQLAGTASLLDRSRMLSLQLTVSMTGEAVDLGVQPLTEILSGHASRISSLTMHCPSSAVPRIIERLPEMPHLSRLSTQSYQFADMSSIFDLLVSHRGLRTLEFPRNARWDLGDSRQQPIQGVRELTFGPFALDDIWPTLQRLPGLRKLDMRLSSTRDAHRQDIARAFAQITGYCPELEELTMSGLSSRWNDAALQSQSHGRLRAVTLEYKAQRPGQIPGSSILEHMSGTIDFAVRRQGYRVTLEARSASKIRRISFLERTMEVGPVWPESGLRRTLQNTRIRYLHIHWAMRRLIVEGGVHLRDVEIIEILLPQSVSLGGGANDERDSQSWRSDTWFDRIRAVVCKREGRRRHGCDRERVGVTSITTFLQGILAASTTGNVTVTMDESDTEIRRKFLSSLPMAQFA